MIWFLHLNDDVTVTLMLLCFHVIINPFLTNAPILYPNKTPENFLNNFQKHRICLKIAYNPTYFLTTTTYHLQRLPPTTEFV